MKERRAREASRTMKEGRTRKGPSARERQTVSWRKKRKAHHSRIKYPPMQSTLFQEVKMLLFYNPKMDKELWDDEGDSASESRLGRDHERKHKGGSHDHGRYRQTNRNRYHQNEGNRYHKSDSESSRDSEYDSEGASIESSGGNDEIESVISKESDKVTASIEDSTSTRNDEVTGTEDSVSEEIRSTEDSVSDGITGEGGNESEKTSVTQDLIKKRPAIFNRGAIYLQAEEGKEFNPNKKKRHQQVLFRWPSKKDRSFGLSVTMKKIVPSPERKVFVDTKFAEANPKDVIMSTGIDEKDLKTETKVESCSDIPQEVSIAMNEFESIKDIYSASDKDRVKSLVADVKKKKALHISRTACEDSLDVQLMNPKSTQNSTSDSPSSQALLAEKHIVSEPDFESVKRLYANSKKVTSLAHDARISKSSASQSMNSGSKRSTSSDGKTKSSSSLRDPAPKHAAAVETSPPIVVESPPPVIDTPLVVVENVAPPIVTAMPTLWDQATEPFKSMPDTSDLPSSQALLAEKHIVSEPDFESVKRLYANSKKVTSLAHDVRMSKSSASQSMNSGSKRSTSSDGKTKSSSSLRDPAPKHAAAVETSPPIVVETPPPVIDTPLVVVENVAPPIVTTTPTLSNQATEPFKSMPNPLESFELPKDSLKNVDMKLPDINALMSSVKSVSGNDFKATFSSISDLTESLKSIKVPDMNSIKSSLQGIDLKNFHLPTSPERPQAPGVVLPDTGHFRTLLVLFEKTGPGESDSNFGHEAFFQSLFETLRVAEFGANESTTTSSSANLETNDTDFESIKRLYPYSHKERSKSLSMASTASLSKLEGTVGAEASADGNSAATAVEDSEAVDFDIVKQLYADLSKAKARPLVAEMSSSLSEPHDSVEALASSQEKVAPRAPSVENKGGQSRTIIFPEDIRDDVDFECVKQLYADSSRGITRPMALEMTSSLSKLMVLETTSNMSEPKVLERTSSSSKLKDMLEAVESDREKMMQKVASCDNGNERPLVVQSTSSLSKLRDMVEALDSNKEKALLKTLSSSPSRRKPRVEMMDDREEKDVDFEQVKQLYAEANKSTVKALIAARLRSLVNTLEAKSPKSVCSINDSENMISPSERGKETGEVDSVSHLLVDSNIGRTVPPKAVQTKRTRNPPKVLRSDSGSANHQRTAVPSRKNTIEVNVENDEWLHSSTTEGSELPLVVEKESSLSRLKGIVEALASKPTLPPATIHVPENDWKSPKSPEVSAQEYMAEVDFESVKHLYAKSKKERVKMLLGENDKICEAYPLPYKDNRTLSSTCRDDAIDFEVMRQLYAKVYKDQVASMVQPVEFEQSFSKFKYAGTHKTSPEPFPLPRPSMSTSLDKSSPKKNRSRSRNGDKGSAAFEKALQQKKLYHDVSASWTLDDVIVSSEMSHKSRQASVTMLPPSEIYTVAEKIQVQSSMDTSIDCDASVTSDQESRDPSPVNPQSRRSLTTTRDKSSPLSTKIVSKSMSWGKKHPPHDEMSPRTTTITKSKSWNKRSQGKQRPRHVDPFSFEVLTLQKEDSFL